MSGIDYVKSRFAEKWESLMREGREAQRDGVLREQSPYAPGDEFSLPWSLGWDAEHEKAKERAVERVKELESALAAERARAEAAEAHRAEWQQTAQAYGDYRQRCAENNSAYFDFWNWGMKGEPTGKSEVQS